MRVARCGVAVVAALLVTIAATLVAAPSALAGIVPGPPTAVASTATAHAVDLTWAPPLGPDDVLLTGYVVTRSGGRDATGGLALQARLTRTTTTYRFDDLVPGLRYTVGVAAVYRTETGPAVTRVVAPDASALPRLLSATVTATAPSVRPVRSWDDVLCAWSNPLAQCGHVDATFTTRGYDAVTATGTWAVAATVTRTFGCTDRVTGAFSEPSTSTRRYDLGDADGRVNLQPNGRSANSARYDFRNGGFGDDLPHRVCPPGTSVAQSAVHVDAVVASLFGDYLPGGGHRLLAVIRLPGTDTATPAP